MKTLLLAFCFIGSLSLHAQQSNLPKYKLIFQFRNGSGALRDTGLSRAKYRIWSQSSAYPSYVKWLNLPFAILPSAISGVGLFTDSVSTFSSGQQIGYAFFKTGSSGHFDLDYTETNVGSFVNDSQTPNTVVIITSQGIILQAIQNIGPKTEITANYQQLINLFPNDPSVNQSIQYW